MDNDRLFLNADLGDGGTIRVSVLDAALNPIAGYSETYRR